MFNDTINIDDAFREASYGQMGLHLGDNSGKDPTVAFRYLDTTKAQAGSPATLRDRARADLIALGYNMNISNFRFVLYIVPSGFNSAAGTASVGGQWSNTYATWIDDFALDPEDRDFTDDPDGDSLANGLEAWFGTHPGQFNAGLANLTADSTTVAFTRPQNAAPPSDLTGYYEWSPNLIDWYAGDGVDGTPGGETVNVTSETVDNTSTVTATASGPMGHLFLCAGGRQNPE